ncbi:methionine biosynthesis PLP-dependent protein [Jeotgalibacillus sp. R-1-5s-1]|uniref:methionine biosynthesis PLP-dependent protein n=1 Tax=Jeotgalibacillus sp. R-1-5s-1 TaxID=2555897 RepID=UPI00106D5C7B|nr:methionine biosynthesis PLP-dependent protein [Jeotgalibacillus sp. R-1-5s-1]TFD98410.1 methionine biosynthesis PLP-dependent protein [Jeotgalibacillus sp. R-1-5s-1]
MSYFPETELAQLGNRSEKDTGTVNPPIYLSTAYRHSGLGESTGYDYTRTKNPTRAILEEGIARLEKGDAGFATSSGMAAIQLVLSLFKPGDVILASDDLYGGTYRLFNHWENQYNMKFRYLDTNNADELEKAYTEDVKAVFVETPTNPLMKLTDLNTVGAFTKKYNLLFIADNTFLTPYLQRPIEHGANIVIHSATKYLGGHNDVLAGLVVTKGEELSEKLFQMHNGAGAVLSPMDSWLLIRGMKTLALRMDRHQENAQALADFLTEQTGVTDVIYPKVGGMLSFRLEREEWIDPFLRSTQVISFAESLGGVESFITYPATQTHADIPEEEREKKGICKRLLRFSVGIEQVEDLKNDLKKALEAACKEETAYDRTSL